MNKKLMFLAMAVFVLTATLAVAVNSLTGYGLHLDYSISRYVGLETWSALMFALGNFVVAVAMLYYMYEVGQAWRMPRVFYWCVIIMAMALIGLSVCPIGYFDPAGAVYGTSAPSLIHHTCSRIMFVMMLVVVMMVVLSTRAHRETKYWGIMYLVYGIVCVLGYFTKADWFQGAMLIFESLYLLGFMVLGLKFKKREVEDGKSEG